MGILGHLPAAVYLTMVPVCCVALGVVLRMKQTGQTARAVVKSRDGIVNMLVTGWLSTGMVFGGMYFMATNVSYWFCAFLVVGWPLWMVATNMDAMWLVTWLPDIFWTTR